MALLETVKIHISNLRLVSGEKFDVVPYLGGE